MAIGSQNLSSGRDFQDYDEVMSFGGELALGVGERLENELKNYLSPTKTGGKI